MDSDAVNLFRLLGLRRRTAGRRKECIPINILMRINKEFVQFLVISNAIYSRDGSTHTIPWRDYFRSFQPHLWVQRYCSTFTWKYERWSKNVRKTLQQCGFHNLSPRIRFRGKVLMFSNHSYRRYINFDIISHYTICVILWPLNKWWNSHTD
jgi:hypothetical protein